MSAVTQSSARGVDVGTSSANTCNAPVCAKCQDPVAGPVVKFWMRGDPIDLATCQRTLRELAQREQRSGKFTLRLSRAIDTLDMQREVGQ